MNSVRQQDQTRRLTYSICVALVVRPVEYQSGYTYCLVSIILIFFQRKKSKGCTDVNRMACSDSVAKPVLTGNDSFWKYPHDHFVYSSKLSGRKSTGINHGRSPVSCDGDDKSCGTERMRDTSIRLPVPANDFQTPHRKRFPGQEG